MKPFNQKEQIKGCHKTEGNYGIKEFYVFEVSSFYYLYFFNYYYLFIYFCSFNSTTPECFLFDWSCDRMLKVENVID